MKRLFLWLALLFPLWSFASRADSSIEQIPAKYLSQVSSKVKRMENRVDRASDQALNAYLRQEKRMRQKLAKVDPSAANNIFDHAIDSLSRIKQKFKARLTSAVPFSSVLANDGLDSLQNTISFLNDNEALVGNASGKLKEAAANLGSLKAKMQQTADVQAYINERKQLLKQQLAGYAGFTKDLKAMNETYYYYNEKIKNYTGIFNDREKAEKMAVDLLQKLPAYNDFMSRNSSLASLFNLGSDYNVERTVGNLQVRTVVESVVQNRLGTSPTARQAVSAQLNEASARFNELKDKCPTLNSVAEMPGFEPKKVKSMTFFQRLEPGGNIQFQKTNLYFPTMAEIAVQVGYKLSDRGSVGIGADYKLGIGTGWENISFSHRGVGLRSYLQYRVKGGFYANGGFERNSISTFKGLPQFRDNSAWNSSALLGICKQYRVSPKLKGTITLLYDFLAPHQLPETDRFKLRIGYTK